MSLYNHTFNSTITNFCAEPFDINRVLQREANSQLDRTLAHLKAKGENHHGITQFMGGENLSYQWSLNTDIGVGTLAVYRSGWTVPLVVVDRQLPWCGKPHHEQMAATVDHHVGKSTEEARARQAAIAVAEMLNDLIVKWKKIDLADAERHMPALALEKADLEMFS